MVEISDSYYERAQQSAGKIGIAGGFISAILSLFRPDNNKNSLSFAQSQDGDSSLFSLFSNFISALLNDAPGHNINVPQPVYQQRYNHVPTPFNSTQYSGTQQEMCNEAFSDFVDHLRLREGCENKAYRDSEGKLTVGVGHLVCSRDGIREGQVISDEQVEAFLREDAQEAFIAAQQQAFSIGVTDYNFICSLASVNFQLGTDWYKEHKQTWRLMQEHKWDEAAIEAADSKWEDQTPIRVDDFQEALARMGDINDQNPAQLYASNAPQVLAPTIS